MSEEGTTSSGEIGQDSHWEESRTIGAFSDKSKEILCFSGPYAGPDEKGTQLIPCHFGASRCLQLPTGRLLEELS